MSIIEVVVRLFAPHICVECGAEEDRLLCAGCSAGLRRVASRCYRCLGPTDAFRTCAQCATQTPLFQVVPVTTYHGTPKALVRQLKFERAQAAADELAALMFLGLPHLPADAVLVHIPTATGRVRSRGYDHARLIARDLARRSGLQHQTLLGRVGQARQVGASRSKRLEQLTAAFRPLHPDVVRGKHIVLVDDVLTTGATLEAAAQVLRKAGAAQVSAIVFAQA